MHNLNMLKSIEIIFVLALFALAVFIVFPTTTKFTNCFAVASGQIKELPIVPQVTKDIFCQDGQRVILSLNSCVSEVKSSNIVAPLLFRLAMQFPQARNISSTLVKHNQVCPSYPVPSSF